MTVLNNYWEVLSKYFVFTGRASRKEFWYYQLITFVIAFILACVDSAGDLYFDIEIWNYGILTSVYLIAVAIPSWAVLIRRMHDIGVSGWITFPLMVIPLIGQAIIFILCAKKGNVERNEYGEPTVIYAEKTEEASQEALHKNGKISNDFVENEPVAHPFTIDSTLTKPTISIEYKKNKNLIKKWFPFKKKGFYRLYIILSIIISFLVGYDEWEYNIGAFVGMLVFMGVAYFAFIWIYNGFKE
jgi:uncharacterized membrane protein YhaH (DUF805 family)